MADDQPRRLHRIILTETPSLADFTSKAQLQLPCPVSDPEIRHRWSGLSLFGSDAQARRAARRFPMLGSFVAALDIPADAGVNVERTYGSGETDQPGDGASVTIPDPRMTYEVWELKSRSMVMAFDSESDALVLVRQLFAAGWSADDLVLGAEHAALDVDDLPPTLTGPALAARIGGQQ